MSVYRDIYDGIAPFQDRINGPAAGAVLRLLKLQEEVGEVADAYIGLTGANARKGFTHGEIDIANELADVVVTAMVAMHDWTDSPEEFMKGHLQELLERVKTEGS